MKKHYIKLLLFVSTVLPSFSVYYYFYFEKLQRGFQGHHYEYLSIIAFTIALWFFLMPFKKKHIVGWMIFSPFIGSIIGYGMVIFFLSLKATHPTIVPIAAWVFAIVVWPYLQAKIWVLSFLICVFAWLNTLFLKLRRLG